MNGVHAVVLAAGAGVRFGGSKLTADWAGGPLLDGALRAAMAAPVDGVVVVTGAHGASVAAAVDAFARVQAIPMRTVACADHAAGMSASLRCGLAALPTDATAAFIFLGDMPRIPAGLPDRMLATLAGGARAAAPTMGGALGHPVLVSRALFDAFSRAGDGAGGRILRDLGDALARVPVTDEGVLADVDTPADLVRLQARSGSGGASRTAAALEAADETVMRSERVRRSPAAARQKDRDMKLSARNQLEGTVVALIKGAVNGTVRVDIGGGMILTSNITNEAIDELGLAEGDAVTAFVKASDVLIGK